MKADVIGLYVHIPFCVRKCNYCDFCSYSSLSNDERRDYIDALIGEISGYKREPKIKVDTVFFGGGTPSLLSTSEITDIWDAITESFDATCLSEFTIEVNPKTFAADMIPTYRRIGVNRISIGMQSIHEKELKKLGRIHNYQDFLDTYKLAREHFESVCVDVMYGIPHQTPESLRETIGEIILLKPDHVSVYGLIVEEGTPFYRERNTLQLPDEDTECEMYLMAAAMLSEAGYSHYEISNYSLPESSCRHNLKYWRNEEYIGVGVSAASYYGKYRYTNTRNIYEYLRGRDANYQKEICEADELAEYIMLRLRLSEGMLLSDFSSRFGADKLNEMLSRAEKFIAAGYVTLNEGRMALTERGFYVSNYIISELI